MPVYVYYLTSSLEPTHIRYVGITNNLTRRTWQHLNGSFVCKKTSWIKSVLQANEQVVVHVHSIHAARNTASLCESVVIRNLLCEGHMLTNMTSGGDNSYIYSSEAIAKISEAVKKAWMREGYRAQCIATAKARPKNQEAIDLLQKHAQAYRDTEECRRNLSAKSKQRWADPAYKLRMHEIQANIKASPEYRRKISASLKGITRSDSTKRLMSETKKIKCATPEAREQLQAALRKRWDNYRAKQMQK